MSWIDYDNDGFPDLHINNWVYGSNEAVNHLYHNDGDLDLFVANVNDVNNALYLNNGNDNAWIQITLI
ncbi:hypothetical protein JW935_02215 [candidate division KSB1 bacterium]|nr:hypothetical protein [candidate division KSB1 bacterium]